MRAGKLNRLIVVQRASHVVNDAGSPTTTWTDHLRLRAELVDQSTAEFLSAGGDAVRRTAVFRTWYVADVTTADRVLYRNEAHDIVDVIVFDRHGGIELRCTTKGSAAP